MSISWFIGPAEEKDEEVEATEDEGEGTLNVVGNVGGERGTGVVDGKKKSAGSKGRSWTAASGVDTSRCGVEVFKEGAE